MATKHFYEVTFVTDGVESHLTDALACVICLRVCSNAEADKAKDKMLREKLEREKLAGDKDVATQNHDTESSAYKLIITPYQREIYVITMIKIKINEHCRKLANGESTTFGQR